MVAHSAQHPVLDILMAHNMAEARGRGWAGLGSPLLHVV